MELFAVTALLFVLAAVVHGQSSACIECLTTQAFECIDPCDTNPISSECIGCVLTHAAACIQTCLVGTRS